ncbi:MAG: DUF5615 family PIN-like protein [Proteobacteria bacterium]|nr:DUF5615 family PIN-like protein [Pseudomonadota bacterium]
MRSLADECVDAAHVSRLRAAGHDVSYIAESASGATDTDVLRRAHDEGRLLLTEDKDFGDLVFRSGMAPPGVVLLRLDPEKSLLKWTRLDAAIGRFGPNLLGHYVVVEAARFRSRALLKPVRR